MSYFADSVWDYLAKKIDGSRQDGVSRRLLVTVPRLHEEATLALADTIATRCIAADVALTFKVADVVWRTWSSEGRGKADRQGWLDDKGSLTSWRNLAPELGKTSLVVLCGADRVTDAGGLADFHRCDLDTVWQAQMEGSCRTWVARKLNTVGIGDEAADLREFDRLLVPLLDHGKADLLDIGDWLAALELSAASSVRDVQRIMLDQFGRFQLPKFTGFPLERKCVSLSPYIGKANSFFSYTMFLDAREREKATKAIDKIIEVMGTEGDTGLRLDEEAVRGPYANGRTFLAGLRNYIQSEDGADRDRLMGCDFVTIIDKVLKFRKKEPPKPKETLHRLSGSPVEVVLHAVWQTFRELTRDKRFPEAEVRGIEITADRFRHDYENADEPIDAVVDRTELARRHLMRLVGGVDELVKTRLTVPRKGGENLPVTCALADDQVACVYGRMSEPQLEFSVRLALDGGGEAFRRKFAWRLPEIQSYCLAETMIHWAKDGLDSDPFTWKLPAFHLPYYEELLRATDDEETRRVMLQCIRDVRPSDSKLTNLLNREWLASNDILLASLKALAEKYALFVRAAYEKGLHGALFGDQWTELRQAYAAACRLVVDGPAAAESQMAAMLLRCFLVVHRRGPGTGGGWGTEPFEPSGVATVLHPSVLEMLEAQVLFLFSCFNAMCGKELGREDRRSAFAESIWTGYVDLASIQAPVVGLLYNQDQNLDTDVRGQELIYRIGSPAEAEATLSTRLLVRYDSGTDDEEVADAEMFRESRESKLLFRLMTDYFRLHPHARDGLNLAVFRNQDIQPIIAAVHQYVNKLADEKDRRYYVLTPQRRKPYAIGVTVFTASGDDVGVARWIEQWRERWEVAETESKFQAYRSCRFSVAHRMVEARQLGAFQRLINDSLEADIAVLYDFVFAGQGGNRFAEVTPFDVTGRTLKFPILEKSCCAVRHPTDSYRRSRVISNRQFLLGTLHAQVMHRLKNQGVQPGKEFVVLGVGDFAPWRGVIDALHAKTEWVICIDPSMDERLIKIPAGQAGQEREIIGFGSGVGDHGEANYTISTEQFSLADVQVRLAASIQEVYAGTGWSDEKCQLVARGVLREARELSGLSLVRATGVGHYIRDFMAYALARKMLREKRPVLCDNLVSLDAYRHWFDLADNERRPDLLWLTAWLDDNNRVCLKAHLIECKVAQQSDVHLLKARAQITNGLHVLAPAFTPRNSTDPTLTEDNRPDQRYWWLQLHRLVTSKAEIESSRQADVLSALERLAEGDYAIEWGATVFAFWSDDKSMEAKRIGRWTVGNAENVTADIYVMGSGFVQELATAGAGYPKTWAEWEAGAREAVSNICDTLDDVELPPGEDDDEDAPLWDDQQEKDADEDDVAERELSEREHKVESIEPPADEPRPPSVPAPPAVDFSKAPESATGIAIAPALSREAEAQVAFSAVPAIPARVLLGRTVGGGRPVYWEFGHRELGNRHMLVFGTSGMGKTYAIQCALCEFARAGQNSLILDYTDGFVDSRIERAAKAYLKPVQHYIRKEPLPINPFKRQVSVEEGLEFPESPNIIAKRVGAIFKSVYDLGDQQFSVVIDAITEGVRHLGDAFTMEGLTKVLEAFIDDPIRNKARVQGTISKLRPFVDEHPFVAGTADEGWRTMFSDTERRCHIFQFLSVDRHTSRALIEFVLWDLYAFVRRFGNPNTPRVVVLDEVQNLDLGGDAPVAKYLTEGRKFGLSLITATQSIRGIGGVNDPRMSRLFQAEHKLFFKPTENEMREHAQLLHNAISSISVQDWASRLASLQIGECWSLGRSLNEATGNLAFQAQRIRIAALEDRGFHA